MRIEPEPHHDDDTSGRYALIFGIVAILCAFVPVVGDFVAAPTGVIAIVLGLIGIREHDSGRTSKIIRAAAGTILGAVALFTVVLMFIVARPPG